MKIWTILALLLGLSPAFAQSSPLAEGIPTTEFSDDATVAKRIQSGLRIVSNLDCGNGQRCAPATPEELATPPISISEAKIALMQGTIGGGAEHCGLDWRESNLAPMLDYFRKELKKNGRQVALMHSIYGGAYSRTKRQMAKQGPCNDQLKQAFEKHINFTPPTQ